jgi:[ribosomal protein S5]-alanine N-acetyltransferase
MAEWLYHTPRLNWRALSMQHDQATIYRQFADPDMCRYYDEPPCTLAEAQDIITHYASAPQSAGYRRYVLMHHDTGAFVGTCGYHFLNRDHRSVEIGYDIWKQYWRRGYAREMLPQLLSICFAIAEINLVYAVILPDNRASISVVNAAGFAQITPPPRIADTPYAVYGITRETFYSTTRSPGTSS